MACPPWRKTTHAKLESSSLEISGSSAPSPRSCGAADRRSSKIRRAYAWPPSPHTTVAMPSAATATFGRPVLVPAIAAGSMSRGPGTPLNVVALRSSRAARTSPAADQVR